MTLKQAIKEKYDLYKQAFEADGASDLFPIRKNLIDSTKSNSRKWQAKNN